MRCATLVAALVKSEYRRSGRRQESGTAVTKADATAIAWYETPSKPVKIDTLLQLAAGWTDLGQEGIDPRPLLVHRARLWFQGLVHQRINYVLHLAFDRIGADQYAMLQAAPLSAGRPVRVQMPSSNTTSWALELSELPGLHVDRMSAEE